MTPGRRLAAAGSLGLLAAVGLLAAPAVAEPEPAAAEPEPAAAEPEPDARRVLADLRQLHELIERYRRDAGEPPPDARALGALARVGTPAVRQDEGTPVDGWGRGYRYARDTSERGYALYSTGRDGVDDGGRGDDLVSRETADKRAYPELLVAQRRALQLFPLLLLIALAPLAWALLRWLRR